MTEGFVYLMKGVEGYKIGRSRSPEERLNQIKCYVPSIELIHTFEADDSPLAEISLHKWFAGRRISGEWFNLLPKSVEDIKKIVGFKDGKFVFEQKNEVVV